MTTEEFWKWVEHHKTLFQLLSEADNAMFRAWWPLLQGFELAECIEASNWIATDAATRFRTEHVHLLSSRINDRRMEMHREQIEAHDFDSSSCGVCKGTGLAIVPHLDSVVNGVWSGKYTVAVYCDCSKGRFMHEQACEAYRKSKKKGAPMNLARYELRVPHWPQLMQEKENRQRDEQDALGAARMADEQEGEIQKLKRQIGGMP